MVLYDRDRPYLLYLRAVVVETAASGREQALDDCTATAADADAVPAPSPPPLWLSEVEDRLFNIATALTHRKR